MKLKHKNISKRICAGLIFTVSAAGSFAQDGHAVHSAETAMQLRRENRIVYKNQATKLVEQMTLDEKLSLICMSSKKVNRLNIPDHDWWNEALHGVGRNGLATQFPQSISMASTWNPELIERMASAIADEARAKRPGRELVNAVDPNVIEIWNNVFMEFNRRADGTLDSLPAKTPAVSQGYSRLATDWAGGVAGLPREGFNGEGATEQPFDFPQRKRKNPRNRDLAGVFREW